MGGGCARGKFQCVVYYMHHYKFKKNNICCIRFDLPVCENFKTKKRRKAKLNEFMIFSNTHEAIIDEGNRHTAQRVKKKVQGVFPTAQNLIV